MWKKKKKPVKLSKQETMLEKIQNWINKNYGYLLFIGVFFAFIIFVALILMFGFGTESGGWYNGGVESVV